MKIMNKRLSLLLVLLLTACATGPQKKLEAKVDKRMTAAEAAAVEVKDSDYKTWLFEQTIKIRLSNNPSSKILAQVEEGDKIKAYVKPVGDGWFRIKLPNGTDGFFFGNFAREAKK